MKLLLALQTHDVQFNQSKVSFDELVFAYTHPLYVMFIGTLQDLNIKVDVSNVSKVHVKSLFECIKFNLLPKCLPLSFLRRCIETQPQLIDVLAMNGYTLPFGEEVDTNTLNSFLKYQPDAMFIQYTQYLSSNQLQHNATSGLGLAFDSVMKQLDQVVSNIVQQQSCPQLHTIIQPFIGCLPSRKLQC